MEIANLLSTTVLLLALILPAIYSVEIAKSTDGSLKPPLVVNPIDHITSGQDKSEAEHSLLREKRQNNNEADKIMTDIEKPKPPPNFNPLEDLILNQDKNGFNSGASLSRVKRQYNRRYPYPYQYPIPIFIGGGFGGYGGRGFGGGFGGRGFGGGFGGRGFGGRGFGGGFGGRGVGGGFGGGRGGRG